MAKVQVVLFSLLLYILYYLKVVVEARYILEIRAHTYQNKGHGDSKGLCCETILSPPSCTLNCDNIFVFCLRSAGMARDDNPQNCPLGRFDTVDDVPGGDAITFSSVNITSEVPNPMTFIGDVWPGQVQFYIEVTDEDTETDNDHVDDIYVDISLSPSASVDSQVMSYNGDHGNGRIQLSFRVQCEEFFFGQNCTTFCQPTDDSTGHYTCAPDGERICLQGYSGLFCDQLLADTTVPVTAATTVTGSPGREANANTAAIIGGGVGAGVGAVVLLMVIIIVITCIGTKGRKRNKKPLPPNTSFNHPNGSRADIICNTSPNEAYGADYNVLSSGTQPNLAYGAGSNNDEETGTYTYIYAAAGGQ